MNENITPRPRRPTLEEVCHRFEMWRKDRRARGPIPESLWQAAVELCAAHSVFHVCRALRLNYSDLKRRVEKAGGSAVVGRDQCPPVEFVPFDLGASVMAPGCIVEMEAPNGAKMKIYFRDCQQDFNAAELSAVFWREGS
jgi:hypothetical protein